MADTKISALTSVAAQALTDEYVVNQGGTTKKISVDNMGVQGTFTATLTAFTTPPTTPPTTTAYYRIIGNWVDLQLTFTNVDTSGAVGILEVTGLPAAITAATRQYGTAWQSGVATTTLGQIANINGTTIRLSEINTTSELSIIAGTTKYLRINMSYRI